jgi:hypothetical protein
MEDLTAEELGVTSPDDSTLHDGGSDYRGDDEHRAGAGAGGKGLRRGIFKAASIQDKLLEKYASSGSLLSSRRY